MRKTTLAVIIGNRDFFPTALCLEGRQTILNVLEEEGFEAICLGPEETNAGAVETDAEARRCAELFRKHADTIDGVLISLPNFGGEKQIAAAIRDAGLHVPVLVHAFPDELNALDVQHRRDGFCGKISVCNNLRQYGIPYSLTTLHTVDPTSASFREDLRRFGMICRIVRGLKGLRIGAIGARPAAFNTVRFSEKLLERYGITVEPVDLSEILGKAERLSDSDPAVQAKLEAIRSYVNTSGVPASSLAKMARFGAVVDEWVRAHGVSATAVQCWNAIEQFFGVVPCTVMSMMSNNLLPSACEVDVMGALSMFILQQASARPSALVDWNNNYGDDPDKAVVFHCSNLPAAFFEESKMEYPPILASTLGQENTYGVIAGRMKATPVTFARVSTDDFTGRLCVYVGEGRLVDDPLNTFGGRGVLEVRNLQGLLQYVCRNGFEHHVAINPALVGQAVAESLETYMGWDVYLHSTQC